MKSSYELKRLRTKYYNLISDINSSIRTLKKVPDELENADSYLNNSFKINDSKIESGKILSYAGKVDTIVSNLRSHISRIEKIIERLNDQILELELEEKMSGL